MIASLFLAVAQTMTFTADRIAADNVTHALAATGNVVGTYAPLTIRGEYMTRAADGTFRFYDPLYATTCTNECGHTHWNVTGDIEYRADDYVILRNAWLQFCEVPIFWLPYLYYPLGTDNGFSWLVGYTGRWGAYLLTKYKYHIVGDLEHEDNTWWLTGATHFDLRYHQGVAVGEDLTWNLGDFGPGDFKIYYAWDNYLDRYDVMGNTWHSDNWGSTVDRDRYVMSFKHSWSPTERDIVRVRGTYYSDSYVRDDYFRSTLFNWKSQFIGYSNSGVFWEHAENSWSLGAEASGRLNDFYGMTGRLPELYLDLSPQPLFGLPVNYETENRIGYLRRDAAKYGEGSFTSPFAYNPGQWADYAAFRFDTYHRLSAPFKTFDDLLSVVPRVGYHGSFWDKGGMENLTGWGWSEDAGNMTRSILEGGITFAGRGSGWVDEKWRHMIEPYFDILAQEAWYSGVGDRERPYVFDNLDASVMWEDQFAGRARNLPYSYYGVTPGLRNAWEKLDERGNLRNIIDFDVYAALQFGKTSYDGISDEHRLAEVGKPNYGEHGCYVMPGARLRWTPKEDIAFLGRAEYDSDNNKIALADAIFQHQLSKTFKYHAQYAVRDHRWWDFSSAAGSDVYATDEFNYANFQYVQLDFEHQPLDWLAWGPYLRWDLRESELDGVGTWIDFMTDCLGFRFTIEYDNAYTCIDGSERDEDWSFNFYIYLRAFGPNMNGMFR